MTMVAENQVGAERARGRGRSRREHETIELRGVRIDALTERAAVEHVLDRLEEGAGGWVVTPNLDILRRLIRDRQYRRLCDRADLLLADGMPLVWAARIQGTPLPGRVAGSDLIWSLTHAAARRRRSVFLLGGNPGTADAAAVRLAERIPDLRVAGCYCPPMGFERSVGQIDTLRERLVEARPDIVYVALGSPKQEQLIARLRCTMNATWFVGVGVSFSFVSGELRRAPTWLRTVGGEWVHRLVQEPRRLARRYLLHGIPFGAGLLLSAGARRVVRGSAGTRGRRLAAEAVCRAGGAETPAHDQPRQAGRAHQLRQIVR